MDEQIERKIKRKKYQEEIVLIEYKGEIIF